MIFTNRIKVFFDQDDGAVTVDWVVLTAAIVGLGVAVLISVTSGTKSVTENLSGTVAGTQVTAAF